MSRRWLAGDFSDVEPRQELPLLLDVVRQACADEVDLRAFFVGLAARDPVAAAEVVAGHRAVAHPRAVRDALPAVVGLEKVVRPTGLYDRLVRLVPETAPEVLALAIQRHAEARWLVALCQRVEAVPGSALLAATRHTEHWQAALDNCAAAGLTEALARAAVEEPVLEPLLASVRAMGPWNALPVAVATAHAHPSLPVVEAVAALIGPRVEPWATALQQAVSAASPPAG